MRRPHLNIDPPKMRHGEADQLADFGELPDAILVSVSQLSPTEGTGLVTTRMVVTG